MLQSATAVFISAMPMSFRVRSLFSSCFNVLHYILVNVSPDLSRLEAIFCFGRIWTDCSLQSYPLESFTVSWWSKIKKERSKKELKQRSKNETKWQKEQPLQLAGFGSGRNACQRMCGYPATSFDLGLDNLRISESQTMECSTVYTRGVRHKFCKTASVFVSVTNGF